MINDKEFDTLESNNNEEINLIYIFKKLKRNIYLILSITTFSTIYSIYYAKNLTPIYNGQFQILVRQDQGKESLTNSIVSGFLPKNLNIGNNNLQKTQELILKSPLVLNPVYEYAKLQYFKRDGVISNISYKEWVGDNLNFEFKDGSDIFEINFKDIDKDLIISILEMISEKYKVYSKRDYNKNLSNELNYLNIQEKIYTDKYEKSYNKFSEFVVENNLNLYVDNNLNLKSLPETKSDSNSSIQSNFPNIYKGLNTKPKYNDQFSLLKAYELERNRYSAKLKPNSRFIKDLDLGISQLKKITEKPKRILLQAQELSKKMIRDEITLEGIKNRIILNKLTSAKQKDPWELISIPTVDDRPVFPNTRNIVLTFFLISLFISSGLSLLRENLIGRIDDLDLIKTKLKAKFVNNINGENTDINVKIAELNINNILSIKSNKKSSSDIGIYSLTEKSLVSDIVKSKKEISLIDFSNFDQIKNFENILIFIEAGKITFKKIKFFNKYFDLFPEKNFYWIYLEDENIS